MALAAFKSSHLRRLCVVRSHCQKIQDQVAVTSLASTKPLIHLSKKNARVDENVCVRVNGLKRGEQVTLQTYVKDGMKSFGSCGHYVADGDGNVNTFQDKSHGGTFDGVEPMGLFWSIKSSPGLKPTRILKSDLTNPYHVRIAVHQGFVDFNELPWTDDFLSLASCDFYQSFMSPGVKCIPVNEDGILGTLFLPAGEGPFPAVIDVFGMTSLYPGHRSALLASNGIASFVIAYVGHKGLANSALDLDYSYFLKAYDWLCRHRAVNADAMGGLGSCVGGAYLSIIAWKRPSMKCFVGINCVVRPSGPQQTVEGEVVEEFPWLLERMKEIEGAISFRPLTTPEDGTPSLPYWRHGTKILHIQGTNDQCVNPDVLKASHSKIPDEFRKNIRFITYPGAGHIIEPPFMPLCRMNFSSIFGMMLLWGGQARSHAHAQMESWPEIVSFLKKNLIGS